MPKVYLVNMNKTNNVQNVTEMINEEKVAAYYTPWKYFIDEIEAGDIIYLYSNGSGIIARGIATGIVELRDIGNHVDMEHYMHLERFETLEASLPSAKITEIAKAMTDEDYTIKFNQTMIHLPYFIGLKVWQHITKYCL
ncbi:hypothetical protein FITA111629_14720 [Filibacter tadaridae]|uniref:EVE domain-containing protein n=1 Tax=Filibacter tadaridae TaxID=2483811 RepID=A0A3P5XG52_9BACL|nr:hypothetical protein [Filibacter tadaridae]VDC33768.1 hypothetical protein FILTAD_03038 [Filibacter tadaridae]